MKAIVCGFGRQDGQVKLFLFEKLGISSINVSGFSQGVHLVRADEEFQADSPFICLIGSESDTKQIIKNIRELAIEFPKAHIFANNNLVE